ncbi:hypothetical protein ACN47E_007585 [Coniothyrium glycines]
MPTPKSAATNPPVAMSPPNNDRTIRNAFLLEAAANLFTIPLITHTRWTLSFLLLHPSHITPSTILFARLFGGLVVGGLTSALLFGATRTRNGVESRRGVYVMLGLGEAVLIPMMVLEWLKGGAADAAVSPVVAAASVAFLVPPMVWRAYVLGVRPELLGRYVDVGREEGGAGAGCK